MHQIQILNTIYNGGKSMDYQKNLNYQNPYTSGQNTINQDQVTKRQARVSQPQVQQQVAYTSSNIAQRQLVYPQATQGEFGQQQFFNTGVCNPTANSMEISFIDTILHLNKGKLGTFYFTYNDSNEWRDRVFKGVIEAVGKDHLIISDPKTGKRYLFLLMYFNWAEFDEEITYEYPFR